MAGSTRDRLLQHSALLVIANGVAALFNLLYHAVCGRMLSFSEYGVLTALLDGILILSVPLVGLSTALTHTSASLAAKEQFPAIRQLAWRWFRGLLIVSVALVAFTWLTRPAIAEWVRFDRPTAVLAASLVLAAGLVLTVWSAILAGMQRFGALAIYIVTVAVSRVGLAGLCMMLFFPVAGYALLGQGLAFGLGMLFCMAIVLRHTQSGTAAPSVPAPVGKYILSSALFLLGLRLLTLSDVLLARHLFDLPIADRYARLTVPARLVMMVTLPIAAVMFPKVVAAREAGGAAGRAVAWRASLLTAALLVPAVAVVAVFPDFVLGIMYGEFTLAGTERETIRWLVAAMIPMAGVNLVVQYGLAGKRWKALLAVPLGAVALLAWCAQGMATPTHLAQSLLAANALTLIAVTAGQWRAQRKVG